MTEQFSSLTAANVAVAATSFVTTLVLARTLGPEEFGQVVFAQALAQVIFILCDPRLEDALMRFVPVFEQTEGYGAPTALFRRLLRIDIGIASATAVISVSIVAWSGLELGTAYRDELLLLAIAQIAAQAPYGTIGAAFGLTDGWSRFGVLDVIRTILTAGAGLTALSVRGAEAYLAAIATCSLIGTCLVGAVAWKRVRARYDSGRDIRLTMPSGILGFTLKSSMASSLAAGTDQIPLAILGATAGPEVLGTFRVALSPGRLIIAAVSPVSAILFPRFSRDAARRQARAIRSTAFRWSLLAAPIVVAGTLLAALLLPSLIPWAFGSRFAPAVDAATLLVAAALVRAAVIWSKVLAPAVGRPGFRAFVVAVEAGLLSVFTYLLASAGIEAVAAAYLATAVVIAAIWLNAVKRLTQALH